METNHQSRVPAPEVHTPQTEICRPSGWRKVTSQLPKVRQLSQVGAQSSVTRNQAIIACKRVAAHIGLKAADVLLLDTLIAFSQTQDWEPGQRPIVWPSNALLMEQTGFSLSTLKRHARKLASVGVLAFCDSPNGKRWGRRNANGDIIEAYGFDLSPLAARAVEFENLAECLVQERTHYQRLKRQITITRRSVYALLQQDAEFATYRETYEALLGRLPKRRASIEELEALLFEFTSLKRRIEDVLFDTHTDSDIDVRPEELTPRETENDPHIQTTNELQPESCNETIANISKTPTDVKALIQAVPELRNWAKHLGMKLSNWDDMFRVVERLRPMIGIADLAWQSALKHMGPYQALTAFALVFEKAQAGEIRSPTGYLTGMAAKAGAGQLHLNRSVYGRLRHHGQRCAA